MYKVNHYIQGTVHARVIKDLIWHVRGRGGERLPYQSFTEVEGVVGADLDATTLCYVDQLYNSWMRFKRCCLHVTSSKNFETTHHVMNILRKILKRYQHHTVLCHVFIILSSSWSRLSVQLLMTLARKLWNSSLTASGSSSRFVWTQVTRESDEAAIEITKNQRNKLTLFKEVNT